MASFVTPKRATAFTFFVSLTSQADVKLFQAAPTLAAGDVVIIKDGVLDGNIDTLPVAVTSATRVLNVTLSIAEMTADNVTVIFSDAAGAEWCDLIVNIQTTAVQLDDLLRSTTPANTLDVSATGEAGLDFANIKAATGATTLTNITVPTVTDVTNAVSANLIQILGATITGTAAQLVAAFTKWFNVAAPTGTINSLPDAVGGATSGVAIVGSLMGLTNDAITSAKFDESTAFPVKSTDSGATQIARVGADGDTLETLSDQLDGYAVAITSVVEGSTINATRGDTLVAALTGLGNITSRTKLWFTVKTDKGDADTVALVQILLSNPADGAADGLLYINGAAAATKANGSLTIVNATTGAVTITLAAAETTKLSEAAGLYYDIQMLTATAVQTMSAGMFNVNADVTRAIT